MRIINIVLLLLLLITVRVQLFCSLGGGVIHFGKDFFP